MKIIVLFTSILFLTACNPLLKPGRKVGPNEPPSPFYMKIDIAKLPTCSVDVACANGYSCTYYGSFDDARCYPDGHESEVIGCKIGELIIFDSYPATVGCY